MSGTHAVRVTLRNGFRVRACGAPRNDEAKGGKNPLHPTAAKNNPYLDFSPESDSLSTRIEGGLIDRAAFQAFPSAIGTHRDLVFTGQINGNRSFRWPLCQSSRALEGSGPDGLKPERKGTGPENRPVKGSNRRHGTETGPATGKDRKRKIPPRRRPPLSSKEGRDGRLVYAAGPLSLSSDVSLTAHGHHPVRLSALYAVPAGRPDKSGHRRIRGRYHSACVCPLPARHA